MTGIAIFFITSVGIFATALWSGWQAPNTLLILSVVAYGILFYLDIRSTVSYGRSAVGTWELSPMFRYLTRRWGFVVSVSVQAVFEVVLVILVVPLYLGRTASLDTTIATITLAILGACHSIGYLHNRNVCVRRKIVDMLHRS